MFSSHRIGDVTVVFAHVAERGAFGLFVQFCNEVGSCLYL